MASRSVSDLTPIAAGLCQKWLDACEKRGVHVLVYCTYRSIDEQNALYAVGRTSPGRIVTNAKGGQSWHNWRRAWDAVPIIAGKAFWVCHTDEQGNPRETPWLIMVQEAEGLGIEWAGRWASFREYCHFQVTEGLTLEQARAQAESVMPPVVEG